MKKTSYFFVITLILAACNGNLNKTDKEDNNVKYGNYINSYYNYSVYFPDFLTPQGEATNLDGQEFVSEDKKIKLLVYRDYKNDYLTGGELYSLDQAFEEDLKSLEEVSNKQIKDNYYIIEYKTENTLHAYYVLLNGDNYFNILFEYPEEEKNRMESIIKYVFESFKVKQSDDIVETQDGDASTEEVDDRFLVFLDEFLNDCFWGKNFNSLLRDNDETLALYLDPKMDIRRYYAPGTTTLLASREDNFAFNSYSDFTSKPEPNNEVIFEYLLDGDHICDVIFDQYNVVYYQYWDELPVVVIDSENFEIASVDLAYENAEIVAAFIPNEYNNPRGFYFVYTPNGWKLAFVDDTLCEA
ncbi:MAG: hypothetical protein PHW82_09550 [Bacteroidales bacterium]|nr:hypothetical protein [Bacteroidales bacterium]